jgi:hypothetical protein
MSFADNYTLLTKLIDDGAIWHGDGATASYKKTPHSPLLGSALESSLEYSKGSSLQSFLQILAHPGVHEFLFDEGNAPAKNIPLLLPTMSLNQIFNAEQIIPGERPSNTRQYDTHHDNNQQDSPLYLWIGKEVWPSPYILKNSRSLFIDVDSDKNKSWSIFTALKSMAVTGVIAHLNRAPFPLTRRLSLIAKEHKTRAFLFRDIKNITQKTAAHSRFIINQIPSQSGAPTWRITLTQIREGWDRSSIEYINEQIPKLAEWIIEMRQDEETVSFNLSAILPERDGTTTETLALAS